MQKLTQKLQEHVWCVITVATVVLLAVISAWLAEEGMAIVSFASSALSIILSVIVIIYMLLQNYAFEGKLVRLEAVLTEISTKTGEDIKSVQESQKAILNAIGQYEPPLPEETAIEESEHSIPRQSFSEFFDVESLNVAGWLALYSLMKALDGKKLFNIHPLISSLVPIIKVGTGTVLTDRELHIGYQGIFISYFKMIKALAGPESILFKNGKWSVTSLPDGLPEAVNKVIQKRIESGILDPPFPLKECIDEIDSYFQKLTVV